MLLNRAGCFSAQILVYALAANLDFDVIDENVADVASPVDCTSILGHSWQVNTEVDLVHQITIARNCRGNLLAEIRGAIECNFNQLLCKVCVTSIHVIDTPPFGVFFEGLDFILCLSSEFCWIPKTQNRQVVEPSPYKCRVEKSTELAMTYVGAWLLIAHICAGFSPYPS